MKWKDSLRIARVKRALSRTYHKPCPRCTGSRTVCRQCGNIICKTCNDHVCKYAIPPKPRGRRPRPSILVNMGTVVAIPAELHALVAAHALEVRSVIEEAHGITLVCSRTDATPIAEIVVKLKPSLPSGWRIWGSGANKPGTFYVTLSPT